MVHAAALPNGTPVRVRVPYTEVIPATPTAAARAANYITPISQRVANGVIRGVSKRYAIEEEGSSAIYIVDFSMLMNFEHVPLSQVPPYHPTLNGRTLFCTFIGSPVYSGYVRAEDQCYYVSDEFGMVTIVPYFDVEPITGPGAGAGAGAPGLGSGPFPGFRTMGGVKKTRKGNKHNRNKTRSSRSRNSHKNQRK
jgi:hypothetical protein